jgi:hypothetical protein
MKAYLDIETSYEGLITVIGILREPGGLVQWISPEIDTYDLLESLSGATAIYTYNGSRFDLPKINSQLGVDLRRLFPCHDLMYTCWRHNLYGGLKEVERQLGISRTLPHLDGRDAMRLWAAYVERGDREALSLLLQYNREDVESLVILREMLEG